nr:unnamed protein product [Digitaria exilis]
MKVAAPAWKREDGSAQNLHQELEGLPPLRCPAGNWLEAQGPSQGRSSVRAVPENRRGRAAHHWPAAGSNRRAWSSAGGARTEPPRVDLNLTGGQRCGDQATPRRCAAPRARNGGCDPRRGLP